MLPSVLLDLVGKKMLFKIRIGPDNKQNRNTHYVVQKFCDNPVMVEEFISGVSCLLTMWSHSLRIFVIHVFFYMFQKTLTASYDSVIDSTFVPSAVGGARVDCAVDVSDGSSNSSELTGTKTVTGVSCLSFMWSYLWCIFIILMFVVCFRRLHLQTAML